MNFKINKSELQKALTNVSGAISSNATLPILEGFLFEVNKEGLRISATDLESHISTAIECNTDGIISVAVPAKILLDVLKTLPDQPLTFQVDEDNYSIEMLSQNGKYKLAGENGADYPKNPIIEDDDFIELPAYTLNKVLQRSIFAVSNDALRPAMTGLYIKADSLGLTMVATDGQKLVKNSISQSTNLNGSFIVPKKALNLVSKVINSDQPLEFSFSDTHVKFKVNGYDVSCRLIDANYPDFEAVIPNASTLHIDIDRADFLNAVRRVKLFSNRTTFQITLSVQGNDMQLIAQDLDFSNEATEKMKVESNVLENYKIAFNGMFLLECLNSLSCDTVRIQLNEPNRAGLLTPLNQDEGDSVTMLIMPIMLDVVV